MSAERLYRDLLDRGLHLRVDDGRLVVGPRRLLADVDDRAIRQHRDELATIVALEADEQDAAPAPRRIHDVPSGCLGPTACAVLGICGRLACMTDEEHDAFAVVVVNARAERNPHRVTRLIDPQDISITSPEEDDRAA